MAAKVSTLVTRQQQMAGWGDTRAMQYGVPVPRHAVPVTAFGSAVVPAYGTQALIVTYKVRANWICLITGLVLQFAGAGPSPLPGDVSWQVDIDRPLGNTVQGFIEKDYAAVPFDVGSFVGGPPWPVEFQHRNGEVIRIKATPIANMGIGAGNFFQAALLGFEWPEPIDDQN